jgi:hypothetical protein
MDGELIVEALQEDFLEKNPIQFSESALKAAVEDTGFSTSEEAAIIERLRGLGYL